jgi:hypothetical protein
MAHYLVTARPLADRMDDLQSKLKARVFLKLEPFGRSLTSSLERARRFPNGTAVWEEEDYCRPPLAQEREAVLDHYFEDLTVQPVEPGDGWELIGELPPLFTGLSQGSPPSPRGHHE